MADIQKNLTNINGALAKAAAKVGRESSAITLIAVSKKKPLEDILAAISAGQSVFGENYVQEAQAKREAISDRSVRFDLIGPLQRNKAKLAVSLFDLIHTVDRIELARELNKQAEAIGKTQEVLIQVNVSAEDSKSGAAPETTLELAREIVANLPNLSLRGLMCIGSYVPVEGSREARAADFMALAALREQLEAQLSLSLPELSMGMSHDFDLAIEYGATLVRVGSAIFGERQ